MSSEHQGTAATEQPAAPGAVARSAVARSGPPCGQGDPRDRRADRRARAAAGGEAIRPGAEDLAEQTRGVRAALAAFGGIASAADVAGQFKHAKTPRVEEILDTLVALGHARRTASGYASA